MHFDENFAERLQSARVKANLSQQELSRISGVAQAQISRYESAVSKPRPSVMAKLALALNVSSEWLSTGLEPTANVEGTVTFQVRLPLDVFTDLSLQASYNSHSLENEIARRLIESLKIDSPHPEDTNLVQPREESFYEYLIREHKSKEAVDSINRILTKVLKKTQN